MELLSKTDYIRTLHSYIPRLVHQDWQTTSCLDSRFQVSFVSLQWLSKSGPLQLTKTRMESLSWRRWIEEEVGPLHGCLLALCDRKNFYAWLSFKQNSFKTRLKRRDAGSQLAVKLWACSFDVVDSTCSVQNLKERENFVFCLASHWSFFSGYFSDY
jgi:hypothetical protein